MSAQITHDPSFPATCKRCGGVLYQPVDFCPYCGTDRPLDTVSLGTRPKAALSALGPTASAPPVPSAAELTPAGSPTADQASANPDYQHHSLLEHGSPLRQVGRWIFPKGLLLASFVLAIAYGAYLLLGESHNQDTTVEDQGMHSSGGSVSPYSAQQQTSASPPAAEAQPQSIAPNTRGMTQLTDVPDSLRVARASLAANNLFDARAALNAALARGADNDDVREIQRDIAAREQRRDTALQGAERCASQRAWACVRQLASEALAIDSSSQDAQSLMEHAILATAWRPPGSANSAPPVSPPTPPLPSANNTANAPVASGKPATADTASAPGNGNSADAEERAIVQFGWKHAAPPAAAH